MLNTNIFFCMILDVLQFNHLKLVFDVQTAKATYFYNYQKKIYIIFRNF